MHTEIILASRSPYRAELLRRLVPDFHVAPADVDESLSDDEGAEEYVRRLSLAKARTVADRYPEPATIIIGSDQAAVREGRILGKPGDLETGVAMLAGAAGREVVFHTGLALIHTGSGETVEAMDTTRVRFRDFGEAEARAYLAREDALDCAGAFRCEGLGIALFERIHNDDPTALVGLPLIALARGLRRLGLDPLAPD